MPGGRSYSSLTRRTTTTADPGASGLTLTVQDTTSFAPLDGLFPYTLLINWGQSDQEIVTATARPTGTTFTITRGQDGTTGQSHPVGATVDHGVSARDFTPDIVPSVWTVYGHSYLSWVNGVTYQTGRTDALFREALNVDWGGWKNYGVGGSLLIKEGRSTGGWARVMQENIRPVHGAPYYPDGGGTVIVWGLNDIGALASSTQAQIRSAYSTVLTAVISRLRASVVFENDYSVGTRTTYGTNFSTVVSGTSDYSSGSSVNQATTTTSATVTMTLPSDYAGEPIAIQWIAQAGAAGGTVTYSGTAGVTGTQSTSSIVTSGAGTHTPVITRITNLTSANAGQTIIATVTSLDAGGAMLFDCWWLESKYAAPVIVANVPRVTNYSGYANAIGDSDVTALNSTIATVVASFDGMAQVADLDSAINKTAAWFSSDGFHPNEFGAGAAAGALVTAVRRLTPTLTATPALNATVSTPVLGAVRKPRLSGNWYSVDAQEPVMSITPTVGDLYAAPFIVTAGREEYNRIALRLSAGGSSASTIRWGIFDDWKWSGYPQCLASEATSASGAMSVGTTAGMVLNPASGNGSIFWAFDPGLYWLAFMFVTAGTGQSFECVTGPDQHGILPTLNPGDLTNLQTPIGWVIGGQSTTALPTVWPSGGFIAGHFPKMALQVV